MSIPGDSQPPFPPFTYETAIEKIGKAEDAWNGRDTAGATSWRLKLPGQIADRHPWSRG